MVVPQNAYAIDYSQTSKEPVHDSTLTVASVLRTQAAGKKAIPTKTLKTKTMKMGQMKTYSLISRSFSFDDVSIKSSNKAVVQCSVCSYEEDGAEYEAPQSYMLFASGFGTSKITLTYKRFVSFEKSNYYVDKKDYVDADGYFDDDSYYEAYDEAYEEYEEAESEGGLKKVAFYKQVFTVRVKSGLVSYLDCDGLFTDEKYPFWQLFYNALYKIQCEAEDSFVYEPCDEGVNIYKDLKDPRLFKSQQSGKFLSGKGYKVTNKGKRIVFTRAGKVTLRYKLKGKVYKIVCKKVHSLSKFKKDAVRAVKNDLLVPNSMKVLSKTLKYHNSFGLYYLNIKYSAKNAYGTRITNSVNVYIGDNSLTVDWDNWLWV